MSLIELPEDIINNIMNNYLSIYDNKFINKKYENDKKNKIILSIRKIKLNYNKFKASMYYKFSNLSISESEIRLFYILYYPKEFIYEFMVLALTKVTSEHKLKLSQIINNVINDDDDEKKLYYYFRQYINLLKIDELIYIGW